MSQIDAETETTCLIAHASNDESQLWHRRLGHSNFRNMNRLVTGNHAVGIPSKKFSTTDLCPTCLKGKQHRMSFKSKLENSISKPLQMLHMDLFGPTNVQSIGKKSYCFVIIDDFTRFSWVYFLHAKSETAELLKEFIIKVENQLECKVKVLRSDNGTEFKNANVDLFCAEKGIARQFSAPRTPQQNGVAERKNRTLIEAARSMLADAKIPITFWDEAIATACFVQNRTLLVQDKQKTSYELLFGRKPNISYLKAFGCPVSILNLSDHLGKFESKSDDGFFLGYSSVSKAYRVFNSKTNIVIETINVKFLENSFPSVAHGPEWLFDLDSLSKSFNSNLFDFS
ncbi:DDE-type integrase/transposase/recombinase, partial [Micrococcus luteus]